MKSFISIWLVFLFLVSPPSGRLQQAVRQYKKENGGGGGSPIKVCRTENRVSGSPWNELDIIVPGGDNFGRDPDIIVFPNSDNTVTIVWSDKENERIHISRFNGRDSLTGEISNKYFCRSNTRLEGFCEIPGDNSMVLGYTRPNKSKDGDDFRIMRLNLNGDTLWNRKIFGSNSMKEDYARCCPGSGGTSRIVYNPVTKNIGFFLGHSRKNSDGIIHQASYIGFISAAGKRLKTGDEWYISHDMDQRMIVRDSLYYLLSHGDGYPRALVFSVWSDNESSGNPLVYSKYFNIPGKTGDNYTGCRTGGITAMSDGTFGIVFTTKINRKQMDVCFIKISGKGKILRTKWLTQNNEDDAKFPKIAGRGKNKILIAWKQNYSTAEFRELDNNGNILSKTTIRDDYANENTNIDFCYTHDMVTCPNGDIVWATGSYRDKKLIVYRIKSTDN